MGDQFYLISNTFALSDELVVVVVVVVVFFI